MRIMGIDPGSRATGYGVVEGGSGRLVHVGHGIVRTAATESVAQRLASIHSGLMEAVARYRPEVAVVERVFVAVNPRSAIVLGQARGAALAALAGAGVAVDEISAREVKRAVTGAGGAGKTDVQSMVMRLLSLEDRPPTDAADALAVAICRASIGRLAGIGVRRRRQRRPASLADLGRAER
jgi:crossover junction endodeoxyribonuclease RuvC